MECHRQCNNHKYLNLSIYKNILLYKHTKTITYRNQVFGNNIQFARTPHFLLVGSCLSTCFCINEATKEFLFTRCHYIYTPNIPSWRTGN